MRFLKDKIYFLFIAAIVVGGIFGLSQFVFSEDVDVIMTVPTQSVCDGVALETGEVCDGAFLDSETCQTQDFDTGDLACSSDCLSFDTSSCSKISSCFLPGTKILMADQSEKNIENVKIGDKVVSKNLETGMLDKSVVGEIESPRRNAYYILNDKLRVTSEHPLFIKKGSGFIGWGSFDPEASYEDHNLKYLNLEIKKIELGDYLQRYDNTWERVNSFIFVEENVQTYNLVGLIPYSNYFADGFLAHNKPVNDPPEISGVASSTTQTTAFISWVATDDSSVSGCTFTYGPIYSLSTTTIPEGSVYSASVSDLTINTSYNFKIICTDNGGKSSTSLGVFITKDILDETAPNILSYNVIPGVTTSSISWVTDEEANEQINYGTTVSYGPKSIDLINYSKEHSVLLIDLIPNTIYHFQILGSDVSGNTTSTDDYEFTTSADIISPPNVEELSVDVGDGNISLVVNWKNPALDTYPDFVGVKVIRKIDNFSSDIDDGTKVYDGDGQTHTDVVPTNISFATEYYYTVFSYDTSGNYSSGAYKYNTVPKPDPETENCTNLTDDDNDGLIDCLDPDCFGEIGCTECSDDDDNDGDGKVDYGEDLVCSSLLDDSESGFCGDEVVETYLGEKCDEGSANGEVCESVCSTECLFNDNSGCITQCNDDEDNDGDGKVDYGEDLACSSLIDNDESGYCGDGDVETYIGEKCDDGDSNGPRCKANCSMGCALNDNSDCGPSGGDVQCNDGKDNDEDGFVDMEDPGCDSASDNDEYNPPEGDIPVVDFNDLLFKAGNREVSLISKDGIVTSLSGSYFSILILADLVNGEPDFLTLRLNGVNNNFKLDKENNLYSVDIVFPTVGLHEAYIEGSYVVSGGSEISLESVLVNLNSLPFGKIVTKDDAPVAGVKVTLFKDGEKIETGIYGQSNPINANVFGRYGWVIPNGNYHLEIEKEGYYVRKTQLFSVSNNVINNNLSLIIKPEKIIDVIDPEAPIQENIVKVVENITEKTKVVAERAVQVFKETVDNPVVEKTANKVVAPAAIGTVVVTALPSIWFNLLNLLRFLFLQPLMLLGRRKRKKWGQVYNSLNKLPVDLVTVRLLDMATNRVVQSRVTDKNGRFIFSVKQGRYKIIAHKHGLIFPSALLSDIKQDGNRTDIYHGEEIVVDEEGTFITPNIPLDPEDEKVKQMFKIKLGKLGRGLQVAFSWLGLIVTIVVLYISPVWYMWVLLVAHLLIFFVFRRLAMPGKPKGWGVVYDESSKKPLGKTIARLFDFKFNKLISTQVTDTKGRYTFLAGGNKYYITFEHDKYNTKNTGEINLLDKEEGIVAIDVNLEKKK